MNEQPAADAKQPEPTYRRNAPKLPPGATFTPTHLVTQTDEGKWVNRRLVAVNESRRARKALGLSGRQLRKLERAEKADRAARLTKGT